MKFILLLLFCLSFSFNAYSQGKIEESKKDVSKTERREKVRNKKKSSLIDGDDFFVSFFGNLAMQFFLYSTYYTFIGDSSDEVHLSNNLARYPYHNNSIGNYTEVNQETGKVKNIRLDVENNFLFESPNLYGNHLKLNFRPVRQFSIGVDYFELLEQVNNGYSNLSLYNFNFNYDRLKFKKFNLGWNLGVNYIANEVQEAGISVGFNTDVFLEKNFSLFGSFKWSEINDAPVNTYEMKIRYHKNRYFAAIGYEHLKIGRPTFNFLSMGAGVYF